MNGTFPIISLILALIATILVFIFIIPERKRPVLNNFGKFLHDLFNFKFLIIEKILQFFYVFATIAIILIGFFTLFQVQRSFYGGSRWIGYYGFVIMLLGPIVVRLVYEFAMMAIIVVKNIIQINNKLKNQNDDVNSASPFAMPNPNEYIPTNAAPTNTYYTNFCPKCGNPLAPDGNCYNPNCPK